MRKGTLLFCCRPSPRHLFGISNSNNNFLTEAVHFSNTTQVSDSLQISNGQNSNGHKKLIKLLREEPSKIQTIRQTKTVHALAVKLGPNPTQPVFLHNQIIGMYLLFKDFLSAENLFEEMPYWNVVSYNTLICGYSRSGFLEKALNLFSEMRFLGHMPTEFTFGGILTCSVLSPFHGLQLLALILKLGVFDRSAVAGTALLTLFGKYGCLDEAIGVFEYIPVKNLVTWNCIISLFAQHGFAENCIFMFKEIMRSGAALSQSSFVAVLSILDLQLGEQVHGLVIKYGLDAAVSVGNLLIHVYGRCSNLGKAERMFEEVSNKDTVSWNTIIGAISKSDRPSKALVVFLKMSACGFLPNEVTFTSLLNSCGRMKILSYGEFIHAKVIKSMFNSDVYVGSALVDFYAKCDNLKDAHRCFYEIKEKNLVCWNALISGYSNRGSSTSVLLLRELLYQGYRPNEFSFSTVVKLLIVVELQQLHSLIIKMGYQDNEYVSSSLITSYAKNGLLYDALKLVPANYSPGSVVSCNVIAGAYNRTGQYEKTQELFSVLEDPDTVSWNILISACSRTSDFKEVFELFEHMKRAGVSPDNYTYASLFTVCTRLCNLALGCSLHGLILKTDFKCCDIFVHNIIMDMYSKCGSLDSSIKIFNEMTERNVFSWTILVSALGLHGFADEALDKFREMEMAGFKPDKVAVLAILSACRHAGLVKQGMQIFEQMKGKYGFEPEMDHYFLVVDLLARHGHLAEAEQFIAKMPFPPNAGIWRSFLEGCKRKSTSVTREEEGEQSYGDSSFQNSRFDLSGTDFSQLDKHLAKESEREVPSGPDPIHNRYSPPKRSEFSYN